MSTKKKSTNENTETIEQEIPTVSYEDYHKESSNKSEILYYVGPGILGVVKRASFHDSIPKSASKMIEANPMLSQLFVKMSDIGTALNQISKKEGKYYTLYKMAMNYKEGR